MLYIYNYIYIKSTSCVHPMHPMKYVYGLHAKLWMRSIFHIDHSFSYVAYSDTQHHVHHEHFFSQRDRRWVNKQSFNRFLQAVTTYICGWSCRQGTISHKSTSSTAGRGCACSKFCMSSSTVGQFRQDIEGGSSISICMTCLCFSASCWRGKNLWVLCGWTICSYTSWSLLL